MLIDQRRYFSGGVLIPAALVVVFHIILYVIRSTDHDPEYESEYFTEHALDGISFILVLANTILVVALCSPILNVNMSAKGNFARFLWWFLLPGTWLGYLTWSGIRSAVLYDDQESNAVYVLSNTIPYIIGLIWSYISYTKKLSVLEEGLPELDIVTKEDRKIPDSHTPPPQAPMG